MTGTTTGQYEPLSETLPTPTPEQIATLDPDRDFEAAYTAGVTFTHRRQHILTVACPRPRCNARVGENCATPNGWLTDFHKDRADLAYGRTRPKRKPRLTDRQAEWLEWAAESDDHRLVGPGQQAAFRGDAAARATADAMLAAGLVHVVAEDEYGERTLELTDLGWSTYWTHRLVIRRSLDYLNHPVTCPCRATQPADNTT